MPRRRPPVLRPLLLAAGFVLLVTLFVQLGPGRVLSLLSSLGWNFAVIIGIFGLHECLRSLALSHCLPREARPPLRSLLRIRFIGEAAGAITRMGPLAAEPARAWLLAGQNKQGMSGYSAAVAELMANSGMSSIANVVIAGTAILTAGLAGPIHILAHVIFWSSLVYVAGLIGIVATRVRIIGHSVRLAGRLPLVGRRITVAPERVRQLEAAITSGLTDRPGDLARMLMLEAAAQVLLLVEVYWAIRSMGAAVSVWSAMYSEVMTRVVSIVEFMGATEMGYAVVFKWLGLTAAVGFTVSFVKTLRSLVTAGLGIGILSLRLPALSSSRSAGMYTDETSA